MYIRMLILPIHEFSISFHLFVITQFLSSGSYNFFKYRFFIILVKFMPRYFIDVTVNRIVLLASLTDGSLLVYKNATDLDTYFVSCYFTEMIYQFWQCFGGLQGFFYTVSCPMQITTLLLLPFQFGCLLLLLHVWLL